MNEGDIQKFWNAHPCGDAIVGGLHERFGGDYDAFFRSYDAWRYKQEGHILRCLDDIDLSGKRVLEIGLGQGAESEQLIRRGASWSGLDLTPESIERVRTRLHSHNLAFDEARCGSVLDIPWNDDSFDIVFSHGVLHHVPDIVQAQSEISRVLKPHGQLVVMLYARRSLNYLLSIMILRRLGMLVVYPLTRMGLMHPKGIIGLHIEGAKATGLREYLRLESFRDRSTDGPLSPFARVYDLNDVKRDFPSFVVSRAYKCYMHAPPLPVHKLPGERLLGWHLWVHMTPRSEEGATA